MLLALNHSRHKLYKKLAWLYDRIYPRIFDYQEVFNLVDGFLRRYNCRKVLEVACGTGRPTALL